MKKTFATTMPDQVGAFLKADECLSQLGVNITRVSYNKAVDMHMLFLEAEGSQEQLCQAETALARLGYLPKQAGLGSVLLVEFKLRDEPGALLPVLRLINQFHFNISYISSRENGGAYQFFKMGLFVENGRELSEFMSRVALLCPVRILDYDKSEKILDNTVFYLSFANDISQKMGFGEAEEKQLIINANQIMQMLDERSSPPYKTFDYIGRFAESIQRCKGEGFVPRVTRLESRGGIPITLIEPPCGSNVTVLTLPGRLLVCDSGFACYREELLSLLRELFPAFDETPKELFLSHADVDHCGCIDLFDKTYVNQKCFDNFQAERQGEAAFREENPLHAPYVRISKILSGYRPPQAGTLQIFGGSSREQDEPLCFLSTLSVGPLCFEVYEGRGGHVKGEMIYLERREHLAFTGDIFVNIKGTTPEQARFNRLAPYLMTSVDTDPELAREEREAFFRLLSPGKWQVFGGHGAVYELDAAEKNEGGTDMYPIWTISAHPEMLDAAVDWFSHKWRIPAQAYRESMSDAIRHPGLVPQWYMVMDGSRIAAGAGLIENDFHDRPDLTPNLCALFVETDYRKQGLAHRLLDFVRQDAGAMGIGQLYLVTDHTDFYEKCGWRFLTMVNDTDGVPERMYTAETF